MAVKASIGSYGTDLTGIHWALFVDVFPPRHSARPFHHISDLDSFSTPQPFHIYFYNYAHRLRLEKLLCLEPSRSSNGFFKPLLDPDDGFNSETAERRFQK